MHSSSHAGVGLHTSGKMTREDKHLGRVYVSFLERRCISDIPTMLCILVFFTKCGWILNVMC